MIYTDENGRTYESVSKENAEEVLIRPYHRRKNITVVARLELRDESEYPSNFVGLKFDSRSNVVWVRKDEVIASKEREII